MTREEIKDELYRMLSDVVNGGYPIRNNTQKGRYREAVKEAIQALEQTRWIPVSERLPEEIGTYMTTVDYEKYGLAVGQRYYHGKGVGWEDDCVIAWMPLPEPYKAESEVQE